MTLSQPEPTRPIPNQVIRHVGDVTYTTTTARPTPEQARQFACLANRLLAPPLEVKAPKRSVARPNPRSPPEITISVHPVCNPGMFTDAQNETGAIDGPGNKALFSSPQGLVVDREGNLYVADSRNETIRRITPDGTVSTFAGKPGERGTVDGQGGSARFDSPTRRARPDRFPGRAPRATGRRSESLVVRFSSPRFAQRVSRATTPWCFAWRRSASSVTVAQSRPG